MAKPTANNMLHGRRFPDLTYADSENWNTQSEINDASISVRSTLQPPTDPSAVLPMPARSEGYPQQVRSRKPRHERKAACTACRQQKLKCDAYLNPESACSRCRKLRLECFHQPGFQRLEVRKSKQSRAVSDEEGSHQSSTDHTHQYASSSKASRTGSISLTCDAAGRAPLFVDSTDSEVLAVHFSDQQTSLGSSDPTVSNLSPSPTRPRQLSDIHVEGNIIDECFQIFFSKYSPLLPIFSSRLLPDECYNMSQTLFWAIVLVGSRSLVSDPTLLRGLGSEVLNIALTSFQSMRTLIDNIKGLLLLCTWPCPTTTILRDNTVALSGLLLNLSLQAGLHTPHTQFARFSGAGTENRSNERSQLATLWLYVVIACDSVMSLGGYAISSGTLACYSFEKTSWQFIPDQLKLRYKAQRILFEAQSSIIELDLDTGSAHNTSQILARVEMLVSKLNHLEVELPSTEGSSLGSIYTKSTRLQIEVLQFYGHADLDNRTGLLNLFQAAISLIVSVKMLDDATRIASYSPMFLSISLSLAGFTLLRMMKSRFIDILDDSTIEDGKACLYTAIRILRQISLVNNDIYAKSAEMLSIMWRNPAIFMTSNPSSFWTLRIRNRLTMSVVFDTIAIWIKDYGYCNAGAAPPLQRSSGNASQRRVLNASEAIYTLPGAMSATKETLEPRSTVGDSDTCGTPALPTDDRWLYELDWNACLDVLMAEQSGGNTVNLNWPVMRSM